MTIINTGKTVVSKYVRKQCPNDCRCSRCQREPSANPVLEYVSTLIEHIPDANDIASEQYVDNAVSGIVVDISNKADKVEAAVDGNFASLNSEGNLEDSGFNAGDFVSEQDLQDHINDTNNPHSVTANQVGADPVGSAATVQSNLTNHELLTTTAHGGIVADTDPRLTDNRNPTLHASTHFASGTDEITPGDIGAIPVVNPATVGNLVALAADGTLTDAGYAADENATPGSVVRRRADGGADIVTLSTSGTVSNPGIIAQGAIGSHVLVVENTANVPTLRHSGLRLDTGILEFLGDNAPAHRAAQRAEIGAAALGANTFSGNQNLGGSALVNYSVVEVVVSISGAYNLDLSAGTLFIITVTGDVTISFTNTPGSGRARSATVYLIQANGGDHAVTFVGVKWANGAAPDLELPNGEETHLTFVASNAAGITGYLAAENVS